MEARGVALGQNTSNSAEQRTQLEDLLAEKGEVEARLLETSSRLEETAAVVELVRTTSQEQLSRERMRSQGVVEQATAEKAALEASHTEQAEVLQRMLNGARHMTPHLTPRDSRYRCCSG